MKFFTVKNWREFQHYQTRNPPWIKLYRDLLKDFDFQTLPAEAQRDLMMIWLLYSEAMEPLPFDAAKIGFAIHAKQPVDLELLARAGFLIVEGKQHASKPLAPASRTQALPSVSLISDSFSSFWDLYLRKEHKQEAAKAWEKLTDDDRSLALADVPKRNVANWRGRELSKIPHPSTYLHQRQWIDELIEPSATNGFVARLSPHDVTPIGPRNTGALEYLKQAERERG